MYARLTPRSAERGNGLTSVALIFGGRSPEHEVSIVSARNVYKQLREAGFEVVPVGIDRNGTWLPGDEAFDALCAPPTSENVTPDLARFAEIVRDEGIDVVFPMVHGVTGEDGAIQGYCKLLGLPYVGGDLLSQSLAWDKLATRTLMAANGIPQPRFLGFYRETFEMDAAVEEIEKELSYPVFVKPARGGSSIGISKAKDREDLRTALDLALEFDYRVIVEEGLEAREIEIAGLGAQSPTLSIPAEIIPGGEFYDFEEKYIKDETRFLTPAEVDSAQLETMHEIASKAWLLLNCYGLARIDFRLTAETAYLNEINTIPGFTPISMYPTLLEKSGISGVELMKRLVELALGRDRLMPCREHFESHQDWYKHT